MALKIALKPSEKFVINGAVVQNGDRRTTLMIHNRSSILREKDILRQEEADTPARRIYFAIQMMYLERGMEPAYYREFVQRIAEFINAIRNEEALSICTQIIETVHDKEFYEGLVLCRKLLKFEETRLSLAAALRSLDDPNGDPDEKVQALLAQAAAYRVDKARQED